jgi:hypothetical protein
MVAHIEGKRRLRDFESRVLRRILGSKRDEVTGDWRKVHNEERNELYSSSNIIPVIKGRIMGCAGHVARMGRRGAYRIMVGKPEGKKPLGRLRLEWEDGIKNDFQDVGCLDVDWIDLAQDRDRWRALVNVAMNFRVPCNAGDFLTS